MSVLALNDVTYRYRGATEAALSGLSLTVDRGRSLGIVGESGSGKTTALRLLLALSTPSEGTVTFDGEPLRPGHRAQVRRLRRAVQPVFQDPYASLNPRMRVDKVVAEPLVSLGVEPDARRRRARVAEALGEVGLDEDALRRYPHEFSGGQRQRIAIARALVTDPEVLIADEPVSALDVTTRVEVIALLAKLRKRRGLSIVMVSHDVSVVAALCDDMLVLEGGRLVESGPTLSLLRDPQESYTQALIGAIPRLG